MSEVGEKQTFAVPTRCIQQDSPGGLQNTEANSLKTIIETPDELSKHTHTHTPCSFLCIFLWRKTSQIHTSRPLSLYFHVSLSVGLYRPGLLFSQSGAAARQPGSQSDAENRRGSMGGGGGLTRNF